MKLILLPGLDGTGALFAPFLRALPAGVHAVTVRYPSQLPLSYLDLAERVRLELPTEEPYVIVAESFSGPVALLLGARPEGDLRAVVLVASFITRPFGRWGTWIARLPLRGLFGVRPPGWALRWLLMERSTGPKMVGAAQKAITETQPAVLAARAREAMRADLTQEAQSCAVRLVCLVAGKDRLLGARMASGLREVSPHVEVLTLAAPHLLLQCAPRECAEAMAALGLLKDT